jgi:hypothetical protein
VQSDGKTGKGRSDAQTAEAFQIGNHPPPEITALRTTESVIPRAKTRPSQFARPIASGFAILNQSEFNQSIGFAKS